MQLQTIDLSTRFWVIKYSVCGVYSLEPMVEVYYLKLNFKKYRNWAIYGPCYQHILFLSYTDTNLKLLTQQYGIHYFRKHVYNGKGCLTSKLTTTDKNNRP